MGPRTRKAFLFGSGLVTEHDASGGTVNDAEQLAAMIATGDQPQNWRAPSPKNQGKRKAALLHYSNNAQRLFFWHSKSLGRYPPGGHPARLTCSVSAFAGSPPLPRRLCAAPSLYSEGAAQSRRGRGGEPAKADTEQVRRAGCPPGGYLPRDLECQKKRRCALLL